MDSYYFLRTKSLSDVDYNAYKSGLMTLNSLTLEMFADEKRLKHGALYQDSLYAKLCEDYAETSAILQFIEQCTTVSTNIDTDNVFQTEYPNKWVGFLGINFTKIEGIHPQRQVVDSATLKTCRIYFWVELIKKGSDDELPSLLKSLFPNYSFSNDALCDLLWWKHNRIEMLDTIIELLNDITVNPFTGGLGKTEVLSYTKEQVVAKRITQKDRLTYTYGKKTVIHRCKEHYQ